MKFFRSLVVILLVQWACIAAARADSGDGVAWDKLQSLNDTHYFSMVERDGTGAEQRYHIFVRVPTGRAEAAARLPTVYLLDGGTNFPMLAAYYRYLRLTEVLPDLLIVGISYGSDDYREGNARSHDFTAPAVERDFWGGARDFDRFLADRLMPRILADYPSDSDRQILFGQSLGGQFALYTAMYGTAPFAAVIASNPALHRNLDFFLKPLARRSTHPMAYISSSENDAPRFREPALAWQAHWRDRAPQWKRTFVDLPKHTHLSANPDAFLNGLLWLQAEGVWPMPASE